MEAKKSLKTVAACALSVAMLFAGAACGTSDGSDDAASSDSGSKASELTGYDVSSVQKDDDIAKLLPDYVTKDGKLTIGMDTSYAPAEFLAEDGKTPVGFDVDIAKALAQVFGLEADPETANFDSIIPSVGSKYDIGISSFTVTKERLEAVDFVSHFDAGSAWAVKKGNPNKIDTSDLCGKKVAVQTATMQETSTARTVAMIGTARATSSISATGPDTVATMISAAAGTMRAVISNGPIPAISSVRASLAAMNAATRITASPMTSAPMTAADSPCATPVRAKAASASIARTRTASYATSVQKVPSVTNAA